MNNSVILKTEKGFVLLTSYMLISVLIVLALALFSRSHIYLRAAENNQRAVIAFNMAEAALDEAIVQLKSLDSSQADTLSRYPCASDYDADDDAVNEGCSVAYTSQDVSGSFQGGYEIWVNDPVGTSGYRQIRVAGHSPVDGSATSGECTGASSTTTGYQCRSIEAFVALDNSLFENALFSENSLTFNGAATTVDSYDSSNGAYGGTNILANGHIASNGTEAAGDISFNGDATINGDIKEGVGVECDAPTAESSIDSEGAHVTKNSEDTLPSAIDNLYRYDSMSVSGNPGTKLIIGPSDPTDPEYGEPVTIYIDGDLTIGANGDIETNSPVTFYVGGEVSLGGNGITNSSEDPSDLLIIMTGDGGVSISGGSEFYGAIFAADSEISLGGNVDIYGAVFGTGVTNGGGNNIHYDENLSDLSLPCVQVSLNAWKQKSTYYST